MSDLVYDAKFRVVRQGENAWVAMGEDARMEGTSESDLREMLKAHIKGVTKQNDGLKFGLRRTWRVKAIKTMEDEEEDEDLGISLFD